MLNYNVLSKTPTHFRNFSGVELTEFNTLNLQIKQKYNACEKKRLSRVDRKRAFGAGHPFKLSLTDRLLMLLVYYHMYPSSTLLGYLFDLSQTSVLKTIRKLEPIVSESLPLPKKQQNKLRRLQTVDEIEVMFPGFKAFLDATEQEIPRPKNKHKRKTHYSGKRKKHTVKTQLTVNKEGLIVHKTSHVKGSMHDYTLYKRSHPLLPDKVRLGLDLGYLGIKVDFPKLYCVLPFKRKNPGRGKRGVKAQELSVEQKASNKALAKERVVVEHTNSRVKKFHIFGDEFRNRLKRYDIMTDIVCGLVNFRIAGSLAI
jgi:DDE superfamily endonuclease/Helix-turn-helix of DDE superfamily endonuclease